MGIRYQRGAEQRVLNAESARIEAPRDVGFLGGGVPLPSRLGDLGERHELPRERHELPQRGPGRSPGRQRILGIFQAVSYTHLTLPTNREV